jgi:hypothetical protein
MSALLWFRLYRLMGIAGSGANGVRPLKEAPVSSKPPLRSSTEENPYGPQFPEGFDATPSGERSAESLADLACVKGLAFIWRCWSSGIRKISSSESPFARAFEIKQKSVKDSVASCRRWCRVVFSFTSLILLYGLGGPDLRLGDIIAGTFLTSMGSV